MDTEYIETYEPLDYPALIMRQIDRVMRARSMVGAYIDRESYSINPKAFAKYVDALYALYFISPPEVQDEVGDPPPRPKNYEVANRRITLKTYDEYLKKLLRALNEAGFMTKRVYEVGKRVSVQQEG